MKFNGVTLTQDTIQKARQWFADNAQACIDEVRSGEVKVNDPESYFEWRKQSASDTLDGKNDHTFAFLQCAYWIQTGECIALLP
jgi:hypothetical protein